MKLKEFHKEICIDTKTLKKQVKIYNRLITDLKKAVNKYHKNSEEGYDASLLSHTDLIEWNKFGNPNKSELYWAQIPNFWQMSIALTYHLLPIPVEDLQ